MKRRAFLGGVSAAGAMAALGWPACTPGGTETPGRRESRLATGWRFLRDDPAGAERPDFDDSAWQPVSLPHTARIEALVTGAAGTPEAQWQGTCWYRYPLCLSSEAMNRRVALRFDGAMNVADVWLDGTHLGTHLGGYLPFVFDLTDRVQPGGDHVLAVRLDNRDNPVTGPKPLAQLDFNLYHGLYRPVFLTETDRLHITDPLLADRPAGGGVFVTFPRVTAAAASVRARVHVRNDHPAPRSFRARVTLHHPAGQVAGTASSPAITLAAGADASTVVEAEVAAPRLWSPATPHLYRLVAEVMDGDRVVDSETLRIGIRHLAISREGLVLNGERLFLRGANRHQEYPWLGYALPDAAQYRDAWLIKEAGFDYVRLSHYPHSPAFMDACDELGLVVMNCIPGWQYFNPDPAFVELQYRNCRDLMRRDRNHPCVALWEVSLNESAMPPGFIARTHAIAHEEYPGDQCFTAGWMPGYDVFIDARQHGGCRGEQQTACLVSEYGDWEYYAMNAGLDQTAWQNLSPAESNSRQLRWQGERAQLQQAANFQEAHNDNLATVAFADGLWVMFDYNRGYAPDIESSGCMDIFRLPKYAREFFRSQRSPGETGAAGGGPMVFIASEWSPGSATDVRVFSNCDEVALRLDGRLIARQGPDRDRMSSRLAHPPFTFPTGGFRAGTLEAVGYLAGREAARHAVSSPGPIERLTLSLDQAGRAPDRRQGDALFCHAAFRDAGGTVVPGAWENVAFGAAGGIRLATARPASSDAGIASTVVRLEPGAGPGAILAVAIVADGQMMRVLGAAVGLDQEPPEWQLRYTTDGSAPGPAGLGYQGPVPASPSLRAAVLVGGRIAAELAADTPKFRIPASAPPDRRDPFRR